MNQHAAALILSALLGELLGTGALPIFAQDPAYSAASKRLLAEQSIEVVGGFDVLGFTLVDENTVVMSIHPDVAVRQVVADLRGRRPWSGTGPSRLRRRERCGCLRQIKTGRRR